MIAVATMVTVSFMVRSLRWQASGNALEDLEVTMAEDQLSH